MTTLIHSLAVLTALAGGGLLYLASNQQRWRATGPWPQRRRWLPGSVMLAASLLLMLQVFGGDTAFFAWLTWSAVALTAAPFIGAWRAHRTGQ